MLPVVPLAVMAAIAGWYLWSVRSGSSRLPAGRAVALGLAEAVLLADVVVAATTSSTDFTAYAVQQILVGLTAPLLLVLASPRLPSGRAANPFGTWVVHAASLFVLYFTGFYGASLHNPAVLQAVYLLWLVTGVLFYVPVAPAGRLRYWPRILYLLLAFPLWAIFGMALESQTTTIASGVALASLHVGAAVLWVAGESVAMLGAIAVFVQWMKADERTEQAKDRANEEAAARQLALWRAARDAAARAS